MSSAFVLEFLQDDEQTVLGVFSTRDLAWRAFVIWQRSDAADRSEAWCRITEYAVDGDPA